MRVLTGHLFVLTLVAVLAGQARAADIPLTVTNREAVARPGEPVTSGVPFAQGAVTLIGHLRLLRGGVEIPAQFQVTARWPDGSIRWALFDCQLDLPASGQVALTLQTGTLPAAVTGITATDSASSLVINTRVASFTFDKSQLVVGGHGFQVQSGGASYQAVPTSWAIEEDGPMKVLVRVDGVWRGAGAPLRDDLNRFRARLAFFRDRSDVRVWLTFRNNNSYGWDAAQGGEGEPRQPDMVLTASTFGPTVLLASGGTYVFGSGVEKTWEAVVPLGGSPGLRTTRYTAAGALVGGDAAPRPLAVASAGYYASTRGWGRIVAPLTGLAPDRQADFDLFERIQRAKIDSSVVQNPPGLTGTTVWGHLSVDLDSWQDYGDLRWDGINQCPGAQHYSSNHYDWIYGMYLQFMRTGTLAFADAARVFARHEIDFDIYHTGVDGPAYNFQKDFEDRLSHNRPEDGCGGWGGRPSHTWSQGYALHWLLTGDRRGKDAFDEIQEGVRQYVYQSFNGEGYIDTSELRIHGWLVENLVNLWRINPSAELATTDYGWKPISTAIRDILRNVFDREAAAGGQGFVVSDEPPAGTVREPLMNAYILEPAIKAYDEVLTFSDAAYASSVLDLVRRMTNWLIAITYGGDTNGSGGYRPRQIPYRFLTTVSVQGEGQLPYLLMAANSAAFLYTTTGGTAFRDYARAAFQDYVRYVGAISPDTYGDPALRTPASYNSNIFVGTASKIHGWSSRFGQYYLATEAPAAPAPFTDDPLQAGATTVRAVHVTELRTRIDALRVRYELAAYSWTNPSMIAGATAISAAHIVELRTALDAVYAAASRPAPTYTDGVLQQGVTMVRAVHITELRAAVVAFE